MQHPGRPVVSGVRRVVLGSAVLLLVVAGVVPVLEMVVRSLTAGGHPGLQAYRGLLGSARQWTLAGNSLLLAGLTTLAARWLGGEAAVRGVPQRPVTVPLGRYRTAVASCGAARRRATLGVAWNHLTTPLPVPARSVPWCSSSRTNPPSSPCCGSA